MVVTPSRPFSSMVMTALHKKWQLITYFAINQQQNPSKDFALRRCILSSFTCCFSCV